MPVEPSNGDSTLVIARLRFLSACRRVRAMHSVQALIRKIHPTANEQAYISSRYSGRVLLAEPEDITRICYEYSAIDDKYRLFEKMFLKLFLSAEVELSIHFGLDQLTEAELIKNQKFRTHVGKFQRFMTSLIDMLGKGPENANDIVEVLRMVGRAHGSVRTMSFTAEKWLIFKNVLLQLLCESKDVHDKAFATWSRILSFVIYEIKDSYLEHVRRARSSSCPQVIEQKIFRRSQYRKNSDLSSTSRRSSRCDATAPS